MSTALTILRILLALSLITLVAGMYRPHWVLWFTAVKHRLGVIRLYGSIALIILLLILLISGLLGHPTAMNEDRPATGKSGGKQILLSSFPYPQTLADEIGFFAKITNNDVGLS